MKTRLAVFAILSTFAVGTIAAEAINPQNEKAEKMFRSSFRTDNPKQWMNRLNQDETMSLCSKFKDHPPQKVREKIEANQTTTIRYPVDGNLVGDRH